MKCVVNSILNSITYILPVDNSHDCWLIDCGDVERVMEQGWNVSGVLLTHAHIDHIYGLNKLIEAFPEALVYTNANGKEGLMNPRWNLSHYHEDVDDFVLAHPENVRVIEGEGTYDLGALKMDVLYVPGHEPSCLAFRIGDDLFTGDAYIPGVKVVATFPRSDRKLAKESEQRLKVLETHGLRIMPGHWVEDKR